MRVLGYGEDALTYWAVSQHVRDVVGPTGPLHDESAIGEVLFFYRPSFGRAAGAGSPQFGEFDAIVGTPKATYLVESKWTGDPIIAGQMMLAARQVLRHQVFAWIRERWLSQCPKDWAAFYHHNRNIEDFSERFQGKPLARPETRLGSNLQYILSSLSMCGEPTKDVLLYFHLKGSVIPQGVTDAPGFVLVPVCFDPLNPAHGGRFIDMQR